MPERGFIFSDQPSPEALLYLRNKGLRPSFDWQDVWAQEHAHAFTVAKATQLEVLDTIRKAVDRALATGQTYEDFAKQLAPRLQGFGWWGRQIVTDPLTGEEVLAQLGSPQRLRLIYDANIRSAHAAGQWERAQRTKAVLPFFIYIETVSREPREEHLAQVGTIAHVDDPYWDTWFPPNGYNCKCGVRQITKSEAEKRGWTPKSKPPPWETRPFVNKRTGIVDEVPVGIDPGWHFNPAKARFSTLDQLLSGKLDDAAPELREIALKDMTSNWLFRRFASSDFYDIAAPEKTPNIAAAVGHVSKELRAVTGQQSGVVWLTPEKPFVNGKPSLAMWAKLPGLIDAGTVVQSSADARYLIFYQRIDGKMYRAEVAVRDVTPQGVRIKGGRLELQYFREVEDDIARHELMIAEGEKRVLRRAIEVPEKPKGPPKPKLPPAPKVHAPSLKLPADGLAGADMSLAEDRATQAAAARRSNEALSYYAGSGYRDINRARRAREELGVPGPNDPIRYGKPETAIRLIDEVLNSAAQLPADIVLYRSVAMTPTELQHIRKTLSFEDFGYASTTRWRRFAERWTIGRDAERSKQVVFVINAGGTKGLPLYHLDEVAITDEGEVLLPRGLRFVVSKIDEGKKLTRVYVNIEATPVGKNTVSSAALTVSCVTVSLVLLVLSAVPGLSSVVDWFCQRGDLTTLNASCMTRPPEGFVVPSFSSVSSVLLRPISDCIGYDAHSAMLCASNGALQPMSCASREQAKCG